MIANPTTNNLLRMEPVLDGVEVWRATVAKVANAVQYFRLPDMGGIQLLDVVGGAWKECAEQAVASGRWDFSPLRSSFSYRDKLQVMSSVLDRMIVQLALNGPGWRMQQELINGCLDDDLMPFPPAFRFRPPLAKNAYSLWFNDYGLWKDVQRLYRFRGFNWVVKCDIRNCFYCIPRGAAFNVLRQYMSDVSAQKLMERRMRYPVEYNGSVRDLPAGLPVGEPSSHLLANGYLSEFDHWVIKELEVPYARYVDDMRFFCKTRAEADKVLKAVGKRLQIQFGLMVNLDKSAVEEINGDCDMAAASALLASLKQRVVEPLEEQPIYYRRVPAEEIMCAWNEVRTALSTGKSRAYVEDKVDFLGSLQPTYGGSETFHGIMRTILEYTCTMQTENKGLQRRMASIAMRQMRESGAQGSMPVFKQLADAGDPESSEAAFHNLVVCREDGCREQAEDSLLKKLATGNRDEAEERLKSFVKTHPLSDKLIKAFANSKDPEILAILSGPSDSEQTDRAVGQLSNADPWVRRNAALSLIRFVFASDLKIVSALDKALGKERDRDARLVLLIARGMCRGEKDEFPSKKCHLPKTLLEMAICRAVAQGAIPCVLPTVEMESLISNDEEAGPDDVVPGSYA